MADDKLVVDGFRFKTKAEAIEAKNEYDGVLYMKSRTNIKNPENVYTVYKNIIDKKLFKTPVGMKYLWELRAVLETSGKYSEDELNALAIPVRESAGGKRRSLKDKGVMSRSDVIKSMKKYDIESTYRGRFINSLMVNIVMIIIIIVIIVITKNSNNINILNYKNRLDTEYQSREDALVEWEKELEELESYIEQKEKELGDE